MKKFILAALLLVATPVLAQNIVSSGPVTISNPPPSVLLRRANTFSAAQGINLNATALPTKQTGTILQLANVDATAPRLELDSYGAANFFTGVRRSGTAASPTQVLAGEQIGGFNAMALDDVATIRGPFVSFRSYAAENLTSTNQGGIGCIATTPLTSTTLADQLCVYGSTGVLIGGASATTVPAAKLEIVQAANTQLIKGSGYSVTGSGTTQLMTLSGTLNTSANLAAISLDFTDTASGSSTTFFRIQGGTDGAHLIFAALKGGGIQIGSSGNTAKTNVQGGSTSGSISISTNSSANTTYITSTADNTLQLGSADSATPAAQTFKFQSATGTNIAGVNATIIGSLGRGNANSGDIIFQTGGAIAGSGSTAATATEVFRLKGVTNLIQIASAGNPANGTAAVAATAALGPTGTTCVIASWLKVLDAAGNTRYTPLFSCS